MTELDKEAIKSNLIVDIQRMGQEFQKVLKKSFNIQPDFSFAKENMGCRLVFERMENPNRGKTLSYYQKDVKRSYWVELSLSRSSTYKIQCIIRKYSGDVGEEFQVSKQENYTKKDLENTKRALILWIYNNLKKDLN